MSCLIYTISPPPQLIQIKFLYIILKLITYNRLSRLATSFYSLTFYLNVHSLHLLKSNAYCVVLNVQVKIYSKLWIIGTKKTIQPVIFSAASISRTNRLIYHPSIYLSTWKSQQFIAGPTYRGKQPSTFTSTGDTEGPIILCALHTLPYVNTLSAFPHPLSSLVTHSSRYAHILAQSCEN